MNDEFEWTFNGSRMALDMSLIINYLGSWSKECLK